MISIYRKLDSDDRQIKAGSGLRCEATWSETNATNLRIAVLAIRHNPWAQPTDGQIHVEIDATMFAAERLPQDGPHLLQRCSRWLDDQRRMQTKLTKPSPVFGL